VQVLIIFSFCSQCWRFLRIHNKTPSVAKVLSVQDCKEIFLVHSCIW